MSIRKVNRCSWCGDDPLYVAYHDNEWGLPLHGDQALFELLTLEGAQAGLSWLTVLKRRGNYRKVFEDFDPTSVVAFSEERVVAILQDPTIIRNKLKIASVIKNARAIIALFPEFESFDAYIWGFVDGKPIRHGYTKVSDLPSTDGIAIAMSKDMLKRGFTFVGPTICYAFMQSSGMVNDHVQSCFRYTEV